MPAATYKYKKDLWKYKKDLYKYKKYLYKSYLYLKVFKSTLTAKTGRNREGIMVSLIQCKYTKIYRICQEME
jgi:hypothetical protein